MNTLNLCHAERSAARISFSGKTHGRVVEASRGCILCADANGNVATRQSVALLQRRHIKIDCIRYIGKESNRLEDVDSGSIHSAENGYTEYEDQRRDEWETNVRPALKEISISKLKERTGLSRRTLINARTGRRRPHPNNQRVIKRAIQNLNLGKHSARN